MENIASVSLPVDEELTIKKQRIMPSNPTGREKRISIVTGTHGDELEGQYVCYELSRRIKEHRECLKGIVDIYPALNPLGIDSITRGIPAFDLDMNRIFPGSEDGTMAEYIAHKVIEDISGSHLCVDIHASNIFLMEIPQIRINEITKDELVPLAKMMNVDFIWVHCSATVLESTFAYSLNSIGTPTLVVEMGVGMRITKKYGDQLVEGILNTMKEMGMWTGEVTPVRTPVISYDQDFEVKFINASLAGVFIPVAEHWVNVDEGTHIGDLVDPLTGEVLERITSPCKGILFTLREYPICDEGSLIARILERDEQI
ncbi:MAG: M14 family metallopeptidase [Ruminococcus sp.]